MLHGSACPGIDVDRLVAALDLRPHPTEGGHFAETYRSQEHLTALPDRYEGERSVATAIYYLLRPDTVSALHRLASDEVFHFYLGDPVDMLWLRPDGSGERQTLGQDILGGMRVQLVVPRGVWQGARLRPGGRFALLGCTVAPGFEFADYEHGERAALLASHPAFRSEIEVLTP